MSQDLNYGIAKKKIVLVISMRRIIDNYTAALILPVKSSYHNHWITKPEDNSTFKWMIAKEQLLQAKVGYRSNYVSGYL